MAPPDETYLNDDVLETEDGMRAKFAELQRRMARIVLPSHLPSDTELRYGLRYEIEVLEASIEEIEGWSRESEPDGSNR